MTTVCYLRNTTTGPATPSAYQGTSTSAGASAVTAVTNTAANGTEIQLTQTAGGAQVQWASPPSPVGGWTLTGSTTFKLWGMESNLLANCKFRIRLFKWSATDWTETEVGGGPFDMSAEFTSTSATAYTGTFTPTDMAFAENDRLIIKLYITNVGTMAGGYTVTCRYNRTNAQTSDSNITINPTITFKADGLRLGKAANTLAAATLAASGLIGASFGSLSSTLGALTAAATGTVVNTPQTWSTTAKNSHAVLSNGNLTTTTDATVSTIIDGRAVVPIAAGQKKYWEVHFDSYSGRATGAAAGVANATTTYGDGEWIGSLGYNSVGIYRGSIVYYNGADAADYFTYVNGDTICVAVDFDHHTIWWRKNNGDWNINPAADPANNVGGFSIANTTGNLYPAYGLYNDAGAKDQWTANFGASAFAYTPPNGFTGFAAVVVSEGTLSVTLDALTAAGTGTVAQTVHTATLGVTLGTMTLAGTAKLLAKGTLSATLGALTAAGSGTVANTVFTGTLSVTLGTLTAAGSGTVANTIYTGTLSATLGALTLAGTGKVVAKGTLAATLGTLILSGSGEVHDRLATGTLAVTLGSLALAGSGTVANTVFTGTLSQTLAALSLAASGDLITNGAFSATLGTLTLTGSGSVANRIATGTLSQTLVALTLAGTGTVANTVFTGTLSQTLAALSLSGSGSVAWPIAEGTLSQTLATLSLAGSGTVANTVYTGTLTVTLGTLTLAAIGKVPAQGSVDVSLGSVALAGSGSVSDRIAFGQLAVTLGNVALAGSGTVAQTVHQGTLETTLGSLTLSATAKIPAQATLGVTLGALALIGSGTVGNQVFTGTLDATLDDDTLAAFGSVEETVHTGTLDVLLGLTTLGGLGGVLIEGESDIGLAAAQLVALGRLGKLPVRIIRLQGTLIRLVKQTTTLGAIPGEDIEVYEDGNLVFEQQSGGSATVTLAATAIHKVRLEASHQPVIQMTGLLVRELEVA